MNVKLDTEAIRYMGAFLQYTGVQPKDCIEEGDYIYFVVDSQRFSEALGKDARKIRILSRALNKNIKLLPYLSDALEMVKAMIPQARDIRTENGAFVVTVSYQDRAKVLGKRGCHIKAMKEIMQRHFAIADLKIRA